MTPSNVDQGYVLRRLIRRAVRYGRQIGLRRGSLSLIADSYIQKYADVYPEMVRNRDRVLDEINKEEERFIKTVSMGLKEFEKIASSLEGPFIDGKTAFRLTTLSASPSR